MVLFLKDLNRRSPWYKSGDARRGRVERGYQSRFRQCHGDPGLELVAAVVRPDTGRRSGSEPTRNDSPDWLRVADRVFTTEIAEDMIPPTDTDRDPHCARRATCCGLRNPERSRPNAGTHPTLRRRDPHRPETLRLAVTKPQLAPPKISNHEETIVLAPEMSSGASTQQTHYPRGTELCHKRTHCDPFKSCSCQPATP
jgi:hypothetical protein